MTASRLWAIAAFIAVALVSLCFGIWLRAIYAPEWKAPDPTQPKTAAMHPWAVEADCYSQLARVQRILNGQGLIQNHFTVENWPEGLTPSTTAPFDYVILLLYAPLCLFTKYPLDWAGALVSPFLWIVLVLFWSLFRSREFTLAGRAVLLMGAAAMPAFLWATACGRPRHQSLILLLLAMGLTAEYERWQIELTPKRAWNIFAGIVWGLACWTSLFEPIVVVGSLVLFNLVARRRENLTFLVSYGVVMLVALLIERVHIYVPPAEYHETLLRWLSTIAEVQPVNFAGLMQGMTFLLLMLPFIVWPLCPREGINKSDLYLILLTVLLTVLTILQRRWLYYASLAELLILARYFQLAPFRWPRLVVLVLFIAGMWDADDTEFARQASLPPNLPSPQLAQLSKSITAEGGIMAPWWLSPGLLYFSDHPIVSGSSHCGISGIEASAKFFTATSWADAERILQQRKVRWIVVWDNPTYEFPLLSTSLGILGQPAITDDNKAYADSMVAQLLITDKFLPTAIHLRAVTNNLKLYEYTPDGT